MKRNRLLSVFLAAIVLLLACPTDSSSDGTDDDQTQGNVYYGNESGGTLTISNNTQKDMVIFQGWTPDDSNILGGIRAQTARDFDLTDDVDDFDVGGLMTLRGMSRDEYEANRDNLSLAKIEYSAMATYGAGKKYRTEINPNYTGDFCYKVINSGRFGLELRKDSSDGEKIAYIPANTSNATLYAKTPDSLSIFPVYVYCNKSTGQITTLSPSSSFESVEVSPRPFSDNIVPSLRFPPDNSTLWDDFIAQLESPAYITVINTVPNQAVRFTLGDSTLYAQNGYDAVNTGEQLTFEVDSTESGTAKNIGVSLFAGTLTIPAYFTGETVEPLIESGYDYTLTISFNGGLVSDSGNYTASLTKGTKRVL
jgi:hypothetical protein